MLNDLAAFIGEYSLIREGEQVTCAVSGGADSVALLFALYLLQEKLHFTLHAAHFNHHLRGEASNADEDFVRRLCDRYDIPLAVGEAQVRPGPKGLEAAARDARYAFLRSLPGKIATAHTADDNAETVLMHLLRGTGLKGLGAIAPIQGNLIRPMLRITRAQVEAFLDEYCLRHIEDGSNATDDFLRNRIRHRVVPLLTAENPSFAAGVSAAALRLRQDEALLQSLLEPDLPDNTRLRSMPPSLRSRYLERFLKHSGVPEPEQRHLDAVEALLYSDRPSARIDLPGGIVIARRYDTLEVCSEAAPIPLTALPVPGILELPECGITITCQQAEEIIQKENQFTLPAGGQLFVRSRCTGDTIRLPGGTKTLKKLMIDRKIPASRRCRVPVLTDGEAVLAVGGIGVNQDRAASALPAVLIRIDYR